MSVAEARIYTADNPAVFLGALDLAYDVRWQHAFSEVGGGEAALNLLDADIAIADVGNIVRIAIDGTERHAWLIEHKHTVSIAESYEDEEVRLSGRGRLALFEEATVFPELGVDRKPQFDSRVFNWASTYFDDSAWVFATDLKWQNDPTGPWVGAPENWPSILGFASWIWAGDGTIAPATVGDVHFRQWFFVDEEKTIRVYATADDRIEVWLDGGLLLRGDDEYLWGDTKYADIFVSAGWHLVAIKGSNVDRPSSPGTNVAGVLLGVVELLSGGQTLGAVLLQTDATWLTSGYGPSPGMTWGEILGILLDEAHLRGDLLTLDRSFTDALDSAAVAWGETVDFGVPVGTTYLSVLRTAAQAYVDIDLPVSSFDLDVYVSAGTDLSGTVALAEGSNIARLEHDTDADRHATVALVRYRDGYVEIEDPSVALGAPRKVVFIDASHAPSVDEATKLANAMFDRFREPVEATTARMFTIAGATPYVDFDPGDWISVPNEGGAAEAMRVRAITGSEDEFGYVEFVPELKTLGEEADQQLQRWLRRMESGTLGGALETVSSSSESVSRGKTISAVGIGGSVPTITVAAFNSHNASLADFVCTGSADQVKILEAWAALKASVGSADGGGGRLVLLGGSYDLTESLELDCDSTNRLAVWGFGARLIANGDTYPNNDFNALVVLNGGSIHPEIRGLSIDGNGRAYNCLEVSNVTDCLVEFCRAISARRDGYDIGGFFTKVIACDAYSCGWNGFDLGGTYNSAIACTAQSCGANGQATLGGYDSGGWGDGFVIGQAECKAVACVAYQCAVNGFSGGGSATDCFAYDCGGYGFRALDRAVNCSALLNGQSAGGVGGGFGYVERQTGCYSQQNGGLAGFVLTGSQGRAFGCESFQDSADGFLIDTYAHVAGCKVHHAGIAANNTYSAFHLTGAADGSFVTACQALADSGGGLSNKAKAAVTIDTNCIGAKVVGNDFKVPFGGAWVTAPIIDNGTGTLLTWPNHATYGDNFT